MSSKAGRKGRFFGRTQRERMLVDNRLEEADQTPDPRMSSQAWAEWLLLTSQLEEAEAESR